MNNINQALIRFSFLLMLIFGGVFVIRLVRYNELLLDQFVRS